MKCANIQDMTKGWFIGNFEPSLLKTNDVEVGLKRYTKGNRESAHYHKVATEFTVVISGEVRMNGIVYGSDSIIVTEPNEITDFEALEDTVTLVVKIPGANGDKYLSGIKESKC